MIAAADARLRSLAGKPAALQGHRLVASATVLRLTFFVGYYALNVLFAADKFVAALTFPSFLICCYNILRIRRSCASVEDMLLEKLKYEEELRARQEPRLRRPEKG